MSQRVTAYLDEGALRALNSLTRRFGKPRREIIQHALAYYCPKVLNSPGPKSRKGRPKRETKTKVPRD